MRLSPRLGIALVIRRQLRRRSRRWSWSGLRAGPPLISSSRRLKRDGSYSARAISLACKLDWSINAYRPQFYVTYTDCDGRGIGVEQPGSLRHIEGISMAKLPIHTI